MALFATERTSLASRLKSHDRNESAAVSDQTTRCCHRLYSQDLARSPSQSRPGLRAPSRRRQRTAQARRERAEKKVETPGSLYLVVLSSAVSVLEADLP